MVARVLGPVVPVAIYGSKRPLSPSDDQEVSTE